MTDLGIYDFDLDGTVDPSAVDSDGNGVLDRNLVNLDGEPDGELWVLDSNEDSWADAGWVDVDGVGGHELWFGDSNQDGVPEAAGVDVDGDWSVDQWVAPGSSQSPGLHQPGGLTIVHESPLAPHAGGFSIGHGDIQITSAAAEFHKLHEQMAAGGIFEPSPAGPPPYGYDSPTRHSDSDGIPDRFDREPTIRND